MRNILTDIQAMLSPTQHRPNSVIVGDDLYCAEHSAENAALRNPQYSPEEVEAERSRIIELRAKFKMYRDQEEEEE